LRHAIPDREIVEVCAPREGRMFCLGRQAYRCAQATVTPAELTKPHKRMRKD